MVEKDYQLTANSSDITELRQFLNKYAGLGKKYYVITVETLNIRAGNSTNTQKVGMYVKGDKVYAVNETGGWIQTDRGWISKTYIKPITTRIFNLSKYIQKVNDKLSRLRQPLQTEKTMEKQKERPFEIRKQATESRIDQVQKELDGILKDATLSKLETFINQYKDVLEYRAIVEQAKQAYKKILLSQ
jgi:hypothetical protein